MTETVLTKRQCHALKSLEQGPATKRKGSLWASSCEGPGFSQKTFSLLRSKGLVQSCFLEPGLTGVPYRWEMAFYLTSEGALLCKTQEDKVND